LDGLKKIWWTKVLSARENWIEAFAALLKSVYSWDVLNRLSAIKIPTLIIAGAQDRIMSLEQHEAVHNAIPGSSYIILKDSGHCPHIETPNEFRYLMFGFIDAHKAQ
jgi:pimeloyl-ACP methyl ester carboxylesterase